MAGGALEGANIYGVQIRESANDGSDFSNAVTDYRILFVGEDGLFHLKDSAGTVTTPTGMANPMTTSQDIIVGGSSGAPGALALGAAGGAVSRVNGAVAWNSGTSFPTAATGDRYWRTDRALEYYYDGTRWLCTCPHVLTIDQYNDNQEQPYASGAGAKLPSRVVIPRDLYDMWIIDFRYSIRVNTTNSGSHYWTVTLENNPAVAVLATSNTSADSPDTQYRKVVSVGASVGDSSQRNVFARINPTGTPGTVDWFSAEMTFRFVG